jgi:uncharacterized OB-fold protein
LTRFERGSYRTGARPSSRAFAPRMADYTGPLPLPSPETRPFWEAARRHELSLPRCLSCGELHYYPRGVCPHCLSSDLEWVRCSGRGRLHTFTIVHRGQKGFPLATPYVLAVVQLDEGPRMMTNLVGVDADPATLRFDMPVEVVWADVTPDRTLVHFRPATGASA